MKTLPCCFASALALMLCLDRPAKADEQATRDINLTFEFVVVSLADWSDWLADHPIKADATELRETVRQWSKDKKAEVIETVSMRCRSGQRAKAESIAEVIYPTEYDSASTPQTLSQVHNLVESPATAVKPAQFTTRNVGVTVEVDPLISSEPNIVELNLSPEIVRRLDNQVWPNEQVDPKFRVETPQFFTAKLTTQLSVKSGAPSLIGTMRLPGTGTKDRTNPIVLVFVRADVG